MSRPCVLTGAPIAHRGLWRPGVRPENSLAAFDAACAAGYGVELDVQLTADGEAIVFHDLTLDRLTTESGLVEERATQDLAGLTLLGGARQTIPTLAQALETIAGRALVLIELKTPAGQEGPLEAAVAAALDAYAGPAAALSFNAASLAELARRRPDLTRGLNAAMSAALCPEALCKADFLSVQCELAEDPQVIAWRAAGRAAAAWTARSAEQMRALAGRVDAVMFEGFVP